MKRMLAIVALMALPGFGAESTPSPAASVADAAAMQPAVNTSAAPGNLPATSTPPARAAAPAAATPGARALDRIELDATQITGNRELPRVLYVVPWKRSDLGDLTGKPANSLLDEVLSPVDRDVFKRQNRYYDALKPDSASVGSTGEK